MLHNTIKDDMIKAWKAKDMDTKDVLSMVLAKFKNKTIDLKVSELEDKDAISILQKFIKEMEDEIDGFNSLGRTETVERLTKQLCVVKGYLPKLMSEDDIKAEIEKLDDKSMKSVMAHFKTNFAGKADMSLVSRIAREV